NLVLTSMALALSSAHRRVIDWGGVEGVGGSFRHAAVLHHHRDFLGDRVDFDLCDIETAALGGLDGTGDVLLTETGWPRSAWWLGGVGRGGLRGHFVGGGGWVISVVARGCLAKSPPVVSGGGVGAPAIRSNASCSA